jgi:hypothetical protein
MYDINIDIDGSTEQYQAVVTYRKPDVIKFLTGNGATVIQTLLDLTKGPPLQ